MSGLIFTVRNDYDDDSEAVMFVLLHTTVVESRVMAQMHLLIA